ncbi:MaoC family dehydratase [Nocardioides sp.]|uniref:MaoC family dehydratase n=1 Tax=Nocardioides sp. TaxID=35761 RepID=UPI002737709D|nr:MaoC family dehydratase [Nocardioides sp.]MDP3891461.1 MaoC family dehydratase [Nocardioides sp.]
MTTELRTTTVSNPSALLDLVGVELGTSAPLAVTQEEVDTFADLTRDHQWIHVDVDRAAAGPFGATVVHGFFTLALLPRLLADLLVVEGFSMGVNYGLDRVRFVRPLSPGVEVRAVASLVAAAPIDDGKGVQATARVTLEFADDAQTCCVADMVFRYYD